MPKSIILVSKNNDKLAVIAYGLQTVTLTALYFVRFFYPRIPLLIGLIVDMIIHTQVASTEIVRIISFNGWTLPFVNA